MAPSDSRDACPRLRGIRAVYAWHPGTRGFSFEELPGVPQLDGILGCRWGSRPRSYSSSSSSVHSSTSGAGQFFATLPWARRKEPGGPKGTVTASGFMGMVSKLLRKRGQPSVTIPLMKHWATRVRGAIVAPLPREGSHAPVMARRPS